MASHYRIQSDPDCSGREAMLASSKLDDLNENGLDYEDYEDYEDQETTLAGAAALVEMTPAGRCTLFAGNLCAKTRTAPARPDQTDNKQDDK